MKNRRFGNERYAYPSWRERIKKPRKHQSFYESLSKETRDMPPFRCANDEETKVMVFSRVSPK
ncbi:hypothetical protein [Microseira sp. BLCC-F43]|uniref:hypothetical protein n=1 Tax=Microseira sp. BLCC-F43 TaxID=3153602 RepID=UPI0035B8D822